MKSFSSKKLVKNELAALGIFISLDQCLQAKQKIFDYANQKLLIALNNYSKEDFIFKAIEIFHIKRTFFLDEQLTHLNDTFLKDNLSEIKSFLEFTNSEQFSKHHKDIVCTLLLMSYFVPKLDKIRSYCFDFVFPIYIYQQSDIFFKDKQRRFYKLRNTSEIKFVLNNFSLILEDISFKYFLDFVNQILEEMKKYLVQVFLHQTIEDGFCDFFSATFLAEDINRTANTYAQSKNMEFPEKVELLFSFFRVSIYDFFIENK